MARYLAALEAGRRFAVLAVGPGTRTDDALMHCGFDAVVLLDVQLGESVRIVRGSVANVAHRRSVYDVANDETLDGLVLSNRFSRRRATDTLDVTASLLVTTVSATFDSLRAHFGDEKPHTLLSALPLSYFSEMGSLSISFDSLPFDYHYAMGRRPGFEHMNGGVCFDSL